MIKSFLSARISGSEVSKFAIQEDRAAEDFALHRIYSAIYAEQLSNSGLAPRRA